MNKWTTKTLKWRWKTGNYSQKREERIENKTKNNKVWVWYLRFVFNSKVEEGKESSLVRLNGARTEHIDEGSDGVREETAVARGSLGELPDLPGGADFLIRVVGLEEAESLSDNGRGRQWGGSGFRRRVAVGIGVVGAGRWRHCHTSHGPVAQGLSRLLIWDIKMAG